MLYVNISFDYELFMGENFVDEKEILINPTDKLSQMLSELDVSATFFADVCCPIRYRQLGKHTFPVQFDEQLIRLLKQNHDVQLHIHPHWLKASEIGRYIKFDRSTYRLHNWAVNGDYTEVERILHNGKEYLNNLLKPTFPDYKCIAFRAGGYCLQPEKKLADILHKEGLLLDSSVCMGFSYEGDGMLYDYKNVPKEYNLFISEKFGLEDEKQERIDNGIMEVPVAGYRTFPLRLIASKLNKPISTVPQNGKAMSITPRSIKNRGIIDRISYMVNATNMLTFDSYNDRAMVYMLRRMAKESKGKDVYISVISHPKAQSDDHIESMRRALATLKKESEIAFVSMRQIADLIVNEE